MIRRSWLKASAKIADEGGVCRNCGTSVRIERAHIAGRQHDINPPLGWPEDREWKEPYEVWPTRVVPLCGPSTSSHTCHGRAHAGELEWLPILTLEEQLQALADIGSISAAHIRLSPSANPKRVKLSRAA